MSESLEWIKSAACLPFPPEMFILEPGESARAGKMVCAVCPSAIPCLQYALDTKNDIGIWGGTTGSERRKIRKLGLSAASFLAEGDHANP